MQPSCSPSINAPMRRIGPSQVSIAKLTSFMVDPEIKQTVSAGLTCSHYPVNGSIRFALEILPTKG
jgi:hypothetical protein